MKKYYMKYSLFLLIIAICFSCGKVKKTEAETEREQWLLSLNDSIACYKARIDSANLQLERLHAENGKLLENFDYVSNPKEVEGYYIYKGWKDKYPLKTTGIIARLDETEGIEVIAASTKGIFNKIEIDNGRETISSEVVKYDKALNYRIAGLNRVCFMGKSADSLANFISNYSDDRLQVTFIENSPTAKFIVTEEEKKMISETWKLFDKRKEVRMLEREIPMLSKRIAICRQMLEHNDSLQSVQ